MLDSTIIQVKGAKMERTNKPTTAGILNIITGVLGILTAFGYILGFGILTSMMGLPEMGDVPGFVPGIILALAIPILLIAVLALVGGIFGVQRKHWGWALAGSIAAIIAFLPLGIASTVLTAQSRGEFE
jgi:hypothetical protein